MALPTTAAASAERKRVKVYELRENDWFDRGTGFCATSTIQDEARISVDSEDEPERTLLEVRIKKEDVYQKQQDTLIVWTDQEGVDMALSFQEADGCGSIWNMIAEVQQRLPDGADEAPHAVVLPPAELGKLNEIEDMIRRANTTQPGRDTLTKLLITDNYIANLIPLVEMAEDLEDIHSLHKLCNIMKTLILFNESTIIEYVVRDDIILGVVGALEYDPDFPTHKANHRQFLSDASKFKEVVPITDPDIKKRIHFTYRLQYLKDVVLARILDDPTFNVLNGLIFFHQVDIVQHIQSNTVFLRELFAILNSPDIDPQKKRDAVLFVQQACSIAKNLQADCRSSFYQNLIASGLFSAINFALQHQEAAVRVAGTDILVAIIDHDAPMMRNYIFKSVNDKTKPMTDTLIELLLIETDLGVKAQIADAIKVLLDPNANGPSISRPMGGVESNNFLVKLRNNNSGTPTEAFLQTFYEQSAKKLFQPLKDLELRESVADLTIHEVSLYGHLVEILCFFLRQHSFRSKFYILTECLAARIAQLLSSSEKHLKLIALKYFRTCISLTDEFYHRHLIAHDVFTPILAIILATMPRDNLLNSTVLELFEYIKRENIKTLIIHIAESHRDALNSITYVPTFQHILLHYDQLTGAAPSASTAGGPDAADASFATSDADTPGTRRVTVISGGGGRWQGLRDADAEEDAYFNASDDDDEDDVPVTTTTTPLDSTTSTTTSAPPKPLVNYADDDDDPLPTSTDPSTISANGTTQPDPTQPQTQTPTQTPPAPTPLSEKRRRSLDDDADDALVKLAGTPKRRSSDASWTSLTASEIDGAGVGAGGTAAGAGAAGGGAKQADGDDTDPDDNSPAKATPRHPLRRKRSFSGSASGAGAGAVGGAGSRKIAISLGGVKSAGAGAGAGAGAAKDRDKEKT